MRFLSIYKSTDKMIKNYCITENYLLKPWKTITEKRYRKAFPFSEKQIWSGFFSESHASLRSETRNIP